MTKRKTSPKSEPGGARFEMRQRRAGDAAPMNRRAAQVARTPKEVGRSRRERRREGRRSGELTTLRRVAARSASAPSPKRGWATRPAGGSVCLSLPRNYEPPYVGCYARPSLLTGL